MSAFMVSKFHIDMLVATAYYGCKDGEGRWDKPQFKDRTLGYEQLNDLGELLVKENLSSIHARYPDTINNPSATPGPIEAYWLQPYQFNELPNLDQRLTVAQALKAISCYEYQSCEHPEWEQSEAKQFCDRLRHYLITAIKGYDAAEWELMRKPEVA